MRIQNVFFLLFPILMLPGCASLPSKTPSGYLDELARHVDRNHGQMVGSNGPLLAVRHDGEGAILRVATQNYGHVFDLSFPRYPTGLTIGQDISFLGTLEGTEDDLEAYGGKILVIRALALKPLNGTPLDAGSDAELTARWIAGTVDLSPGANPPAPVIAPTPRPMLAAASGAASTLPGATLPPVSPSDKPTSAVKKMLAGWAKLSDAERADFLRRAGVGP
jgi:hypothetical protein